MKTSWDTKTWREQLATTLLRDVYSLTTAYGYEELSDARLQSDIKTVALRCAKEGLAFLTETLPRLGKAFDRALLGDASELSHSGFESEEDGRRPAFLNGLFKLVLSADGDVLPNASPHAVKMIRQVCYLFYKLEVPITPEKVQPVIDSFIENEEQLAEVDLELAQLQKSLAILHANPHSVTTPRMRLCQSARWLLERVFSEFCEDNVFPSHGPGAVSGKEKPWAKWNWTSIPSRTSSVFPLDAYYYASIGHLLDADTSAIADVEPYARVCLVPKNSGGPRLISAEPKELMYLQQGLMREMVRVVESHPITRYCVFFTNQRPNQLASLLSSEKGEAADSYSTLDLKDASDRVSLKLVELLFPDRIYRLLEASRSTGTVLPDGRQIILRKHAPMGSANCFPVMALVIWSLLAAGYMTVVARDPWLRRRKTARELEGIHVYGDDVIVPNSYVDTAMAILTSFGLKLNEAKCCVRGFFRESCGVDAFKGIDVTPTRIRADWARITAQHRYTSFIDYSRDFCDNGYYTTGLLIARHIQGTYPGVPCDRDLVYDDAPALPDEYSVDSKLRKRTVPHLFRREVRVRVAVTKPVRRVTSGWTRLLRYFNAAHSPYTWSPTEGFVSTKPLSTDEYTQRKSSVLEWRWCASPS